MEYLTSAQQAELGAQLQSVLDDLAAEIMQASGIPEGVMDASPAQVGTTAARMAARMP